MSRYIILFSFFVVNFASVSFQLEVVPSTVIQAITDFQGHRPLRYAYKQERYKSLTDMGSLLFVTLSLVKARFFLKNLEMLPKAACTANRLTKFLFDSFINKKEIIAILREKKDFDGNIGKSGWFLTRLKNKGLKKYLDSLSQEMKELMVSINTACGWQWSYRQLMSFFN